MSDLAYLGLAAASELIRGRKLSPVEYVEALLARIDRLDASYNVFIRLMPEEALAAARRAETEIAAGRWRGPLHGVPYALKDIIDVAGVPTTGHSRILADAVAARDAAVTERLAAAGAVLIGKVAAHEFAIGGPSFDLPWPPARNPWDRERIPGGSSSGSAAGLAAGFFPLTIGSDTGGSIRNPAALCGIVGMKPTYGLVSRRGVFPLAFSLDHVGPMTREVRDNALALQAIAGHDPEDPASADRPVPDFVADLDRDLAGLRIGVITRYHARDVEAPAEQLAILEQAARLLAERGAEIREIDLPPLADFNACGQVIMAAESYAVHEQWLRERPEDYGARGRERLLAGATLRAADYLKAMRWRQSLCAAAADAFREVDVAITAASVDPACRFDDMAALGAIYGRQILMPFNVTGQPALAMPAALSASGLPLGVQFVGRPFEDAALYRVAQAYEAAAPWRGARPPALA